jgi:hypothetical protein
VRGDSVSLRDVAWVYPTLPTTGGGSMRLRIRNDPRNLNVLNYALSEMDVRTTGSRLRGAMTFGVGGPVLTVTDVSMRADPMDFRLIRQLNGKDFPVPVGRAAHGVGARARRAARPVRGGLDPRALPRRERRGRGARAGGERGAQHPLPGVHALPRLPRVGRAARTSRRSAT